MDPITLTLVGLVALVLSCSGSKEETLEPHAGDSGRTARDGAVSQNNRDASSPHDAALSKDRYIAPDQARTPDIGSDISPDSSPDAGSPRILTPDVNINPTLRLAIFATDFSPSALLTSFNLETLTPSATPSTIASTDVVLRSNATNLFAIDRRNANVSVYNNGFSRLRDIPVDEGTNPQDFLVLPDGSKAYVTRLDAQDGTTDTDDLWILDPNTGGRLGLGGLNFASCTTDDGDPLPRAAQMVLVGARLYVVLQDLSSFFDIDTNGKVAVVDTRTDEVIACILLDGWNPADITYSGPLNKIFVTDSGTYNPDYTIDTSTPYGGIETIDPDTNVSEGIQIDDRDLDGGVSEIRLASAEIAYVITDSKRIASFDPATGAVISTVVYQSPATYPFLGDFTILASGELAIAERGDGAPGDHGIVIPPAAPVDVGQSPSSITFMAGE